MYQNKYLTGFTPTVIQSGSTYVVDYGLGTCHYVYTQLTSRSTDTKIGKRIKQEVLQLIKCDMWKVISVINEEQQLNEGDYGNLNMEIRNHSLQCVTDFINHRGPQ